jgi:uncharacterized protein
VRGGRKDTVRLKRRRPSGNIIDRRGESGVPRGFGRPAVVGTGIGLPVLLVIVVVLLLNGGLGGGSAIDNPLDDLQNPEDQAETSLDIESSSRLERLLFFVFDDAQTFWSDTFAQAGLPYRPARLVLFDTETFSGCGGATATIGPHYCPLDEKIYMDLDFFRDLRDRFGAPGDFAQAYVMAHEVAHHVQHLLGISDEVHREQQFNPESANELSIQLELQADCLAGVWGFTTFERRLLEEGDLEEGLGAAAAVGDDRIQAQSSGRIDVDTWTHGSSEQRMRWFLTGFRNGDPNSCDTFSAETL